MAEDRGISGFGLLMGILAGAAVGALVAYIVINRQKSTVASLSYTAPISAIQSPVTHPAPSYTSTSIASMSPGIMSGDMGGIGMKYSNKEKWKIVRNDTGDIDSIEVIRDANIDGR